jgi:hypothetical protein
MRSEYKYPVRRNDMPALRRELEPYLVPDRLAVTGENGVYVVRSLYYDTPGLTYYQQKVDGLTRRRKVRIRAYNEPAECAMAFLEVKHKDGLRVSKSRAPMHVSHVPLFLESGDAERFIVAQREHPDALAHATHFMYYLRSAHLRPTALIVYRRVAFEGAFDAGFRLTFDYDLRCGVRMGLNDLYSERDLVPFLDDYCVVEVKFSRGMPAWIAEVLHRYDARRDSVSKYCLGIDACRTRHRTHLH